MAGLRATPALRDDLPVGRQLHPELPHAGAGRARPDPRRAPAVESLPVQRHPAARRLQRRGGLPAHLAHSRAPDLHGLDVHPGPHLRRGPARDVHLPPSPGHRRHRGHLRGRHVRLRRLHDRPDRPHRPGRRGGVAAVDPGRRARPHRTAGRRTRTRAVGPSADPLVGAPPDRVPGADPAGRGGRGHHRQRGAGGDLLDLAPGQPGLPPPGRRPAPGGLGGRRPGRPGRRGGPGHGPVAAGSRLPLPVPAGDGHLHLLHQRLAQPPTAGPGGLPLRPRHQPGMAGDLRRHLQLPRGHQLCGHPGPHRRLHPAAEALAPPAGGRPVVDLVPDPGRRGVLLAGRPDPLRPPHVPDPRRPERAAAQPEPPTGRHDAGRAAGLVGPPHPPGPDRPGRDDGRIRLGPGPVADGGSVRGRGHLHPLGLQRHGGRRSSGWRDRSSVDCSRSSTPWAPAPASGWPVW